MYTYTKAMKDKNMFELTLKVLMLHVLICVGGAVIWSMICPTTAKQKARSWVWQHPYIVVIGTSAIVTFVLLAVGFGIKMIG